MHPAALKDRLPHTWSPFFAQFGSFTPIQEAAIPPILAGRNTLIISATASGKTEAAVAPLLERHLFGPFPVAESSLCILYISPTRALVRDLYERLNLPCQRLHISLGMKSGDTGPVSTSNPPTVLITTPESTDSLLTRAPRLLADVQAIILDEIHLFDDEPRGDHLRCLLRRIEIVRRYRQQEVGGADPSPAQRIALSATVPDPQGVVARYLQPDGESTPGLSSGPVIVQVPGSRNLEAQIVPLYGLSDLTTALGWLGTSQQALRKALLFCNSRNEVEQVAAYLREHLPFEAAIYVHYSNLDPALRREVEERFAESPVALCVCTSTLELGIDIGSIDHVVLLGPPPTLTSFLQRIGRGGRRTGMTRVLCLPRSSLEEVRFAGLLALAQQEIADPTHLPPHIYAFRPSVLVQQIFSLLKQSPTGGVRLADVRRVDPSNQSDSALLRMLENLTAQDFLRGGRLGEWRPGPELDRLIDLHEIYSNIGADPLAQILVDAFSGRTLAHTRQRFEKGESLTLGGRLMEVAWRDRYRVAVQPVGGGGMAEELRFETAPFAVPLEIGQAVAAWLEVPANTLCSLAENDGVYLFHFWGKLYGDLLARLLTDHFGGGELTTPVRVENEFCLCLPTPLHHLPPLDSRTLRQQVQILLPEIEGYLPLGRYHSLLPPEIARQSILDQLDLPRFTALYQRANLVPTAAALRPQLQGLL